MKPKVKKSKKSIKKTCPRCGPEYPMVEAHLLGLGKGWICPMNMPYQGCSYWEPK